MTRKILSLFTILALFGALVPQTSLALTSNLLSWSEWSNHGSVNEDAGGKTLIFDEDEGDSQYVYQEVIVDDYSEDYIAIAAFAQVDDIPSDDLTGLPRIYAKVYDEDGDVLDTLDGSSLEYNENNDDEWDILSGVFSMPSNSYKIRLYVEQQEKSDSAKNGVEAVVYKPALHLADSKTEANNFVEDNYSDRLDDLDNVDYTDDNSNNNSDDDDSDFSDWTPSCTDGREVHYFYLTTSSLPYSDDEDSDKDNEMWTLWFANQDSGDWGDWGTGRAIAYSFDGDVEGYFCAKEGDEIRFNGVFDDGSKYLVYNWYGHSEDQITNLWVDNGDEGFDEDECWHESNGNGGYDLVCEVDYSVAID